jgi:hypothetical protein
MLIPVSTASRFTFHFNDNRLSRTVRATDTNWEVCNASLVAGVRKQKPTTAILHVFRAANFTPIRPKPILAA